MKREVYLMPLFPAIAILATERLERVRRAFALFGSRWAAGAGVSPAALGICGIRLRVLSRTVRDGADDRFRFGDGDAWPSCSPPARGDRIACPTLLASALACGVFLLGLQRFEQPMARFDPFPDWGDRVRRECAAGCDGFFVRLNAYSLEFTPASSGRRWEIRGSSWDGRATREDLSSCGATASRSSPSFR